VGNIAEAFEQHLRSLTDAEWSALVKRVRPPSDAPQATTSEVLAGGSNRTENLMRKGCP
jgi:hypothetical protein